MRNYLSLLGNIYRSKYINHHALISNANYASLSVQQKKFIMRIKNAISSGSVDYEKIPSIENYNCIGTYQKLYAGMYPNTSGVVCQNCGAEFPANIMVEYMDLETPDESDDSKPRNFSKFGKHYMCPMCVYLEHKQDIGVCHFCNKHMTKAASYGLGYGREFFALQRMSENEETFYKNFPNATEKQWQICSYLVESSGHVICTDCLEKAGFRREEYDAWEKIFSRYWLKGVKRDFGPIGRSYSIDTPNNVEFYQILKELVDYYEPDISSKKSKFDGSFTYFNMPDPIKAISGNQFKERSTKLNYINQLLSDFYSLMTGKNLKYEAEKGNIIDASESNAVFEISRGSSGTSLSVVIIFENALDLPEKEIEKQLKRRLERQVYCPWNQEETWVYYEKPSYTDKKDIYYSVIQNKVPVCLCEVETKLKNTDVSIDEGTVTITTDIEVVITNKKVGNTGGHSPFSRRF